MNRFCSIFSQLLQLFPRWEFQQLVLETKAERHARGFSSWGQFVAMLFCQLGRAHSLREICGGLASCEGKLHHLGIASPKRSTLSYANKHRPWQLLAIMRKCGILNGRRGGVRDLSMGSLGGNRSRRRRFFFPGNGSSPWEEESRAAPQ